MRRLFISIVLVGLIVPVAARAALTRNLTVGDFGADVYELQTLLNRDSRTQVAVAGPGSPGNETMYFGTLTQSAVVRYQNLYAAETLRPLGLSAGTGYVGAYTRARLAQSTAVAVDTKAAAPKRTITEASNTTETSAHVVENNDLEAFNELNQKNKATILAMVRSQAVLDGYTDDEVTRAVVAVGHAIDEDLNEHYAGKEFDAITTIGEYYDLARRVQENFKSAGVDPGAAESLTAMLLAFVHPKSAHAQIPGVLNGFGGYLGGFVTCTCNPSAVLVPVIGLKGGLFNYTLGTQAFLSYNYPTPSIATMGLYSPAIQLCFMGVPPSCAPVPTLGGITPITGSGAI